MACRGSTSMERFSSRTTTLPCPFHELLPVREKGLSEKASLHDNLIVHGDNLVGLVVDPN